MQQNDPLAMCQTEAEVLVVLHRLLGLEAVDALLSTSTGTREGLRRSANELKRVGLVDLAKLVRSHVRHAKPAPPTFKQRWAQSRST